MLKNKKTVEETRIYNESKERIARIRLTEEVTSDGSKVYDVETAFYGKDVDPILELVDNSPADYQEAWEKFNAVASALTIFEESELA